MPMGQMEASSPDQRIGRREAEMIVVASSIADIRVGTVSGIDTSERTFSLMGLHQGMVHRMGYESEEVFDLVRGMLEFRSTGQHVVVVVSASTTEPYDVSLPVAIDAAVIDDEQRAARYRTLSDRIEEFARMEHGWDLESERSLPPSEDARRVAQVIVDNMLIRSLPLPYVYPEPEGGVSLQWDLDEIGLHADVPSAADKVNLLAWRRDGEGPYRDAVMPTDEIADVSAWLADHLI